MSHRGLKILAIVLAVALVGTNAMWLLDSAGQMYETMFDASERQWAAKYSYADAVDTARDAMLALPAALQETPRPEAIARIARAVGDDDPREDGATATVGRLHLRFDPDGRLVAVRSRWTPCVIFGSEEPTEE